MLNSTPSPSPIALPRRRDSPFKQALRGRGPTGIAVLLLVLAATYFGGPPVGAPLVLLWAWFARVPWRDLGFRRPTSWARLVILGIVAGVALKLVMKAVVMPLLGGPDLNPRYQWLVGNTAALPGILTMVIFSAGLAEEIIARGFLFERLGKILGRSRWTLVAIVLVTSALFGIAHYAEQKWPGATQAFIVGLVAATYFAITRQLWFLIVMHAAFDITAAFIIYLGLESAIANVFY